MSIEDAANAVVWWLCRQPITLAQEVFGHETAPEHFRLGIVQVLPRPQKRVFEVAPLEVPYCYEVKEVSEA